MNIPCENCIVLAICKHKDYHKLFTSCKLLEEAIPTFNKTLDYRDNNAVWELLNILKPTQWKLSVEGYILFKGQDEFHWTGGIQ